MFKENNRKKGRMISLTRTFALLLSIATVFATGQAYGQVSESPAPTSRAVVVLGEIEHIFVDDMTDMFSAGWIYADGSAVRIPANLLIDLPANRMTLRDLMEGAPADCAQNGESGLASSDTCLRSKGLHGGGAQILANRLEDGFLIAGDVFINKAMVGNVAGGIVPPTLAGYVSYIDYDQGYMVINGELGAKPAADGGTDSKGVICRINDPEMRQTIQSGLGCDGGPNCSPDPRFCTDPDNYSMTFVTGYPCCIPSSDAATGLRSQGADSTTGIGDEFCPMSNRNFVGPRGRTVPNSQFYVPIDVGDPIGVEGNFEVSSDGVRYFSTYGGSIGLGLKTKDDDQNPDHIIWMEVEMDCPPFDNARMKTLVIGFSTLDTSQVDFYKLHKDPVSGEDQEYPWGSTVGNIGTTNHGMPPNPGGIFKVGYDVDFLMGAPVSPGVSPCGNLINAGFSVCPNGGTMEEEVALQAPVTREIIGYSLHRETLAPGVTAHDILGNDAQHGMYLTPAGIGHPEFVEVNLHKADFPFVFEGVPWNLDRRLGVGGCAEIAGELACEDPGAVPMGSLALDPFPVSGDPDWVQHSVNNGVPPFSAERLHSYHPFGPGDVLNPNVDDPGARPAEPQLTGLIGAACDATNTAPTAAADTMTAAEDTATAIDLATLVANDSDLEFDTLEVFMIDEGSAEGGSVSSNGSQAVYQSGQDYNGPDEFFYSVTDGHGGISRGSVSITVTPVNDDPTPQLDDLTITSGAEFAFTGDMLLANDTDVDGDTMTVTSITEVAPGASPGTMTATATGWSFLPDPTGGLSAWSYSVEDGNGGSAVSVVRFWVNNSAPVASDDTATLDEDTPTAIAVTLNDTDADFDTLTISGFSSPSQGTLEWMPGEMLLYTPDLDSNGTDSFTYTVTDSKGTESTATANLTINPINDAPRVFHESADTLEDTPVDVAVLANDYDPENDPMTVSIPTNAAFEATITLLPGGVIRFVPFPNSALGLDSSIQYIVTDSHGASSTGMLTVNVIPVNDQPVTGIDSVVMLEDTSATLNVLLNDVDVDNDMLRVSAVEPSAGFPGTVTWDVNGNVTISPDPDAASTTPLLIGYTATDGVLTDDGTISVVIIPVNDDPQAADDLGLTMDEDGSLDIDVLANDSDVDGDTLQIASTSQGVRGSTEIQLDGTIRYTPNPDANGNDLFTYTIHDGNGGSSSATVAVTITPINDAPSAGQLAMLPMAEDGVKTVTAATILSVASDVDGDALRITNVGQPLNGQVSIDTDPVSGDIASLVYQPNPNFHGSDSFTYEITDDVIEGGVLTTTSATLTLNILPVNDFPVAINDANLSATGGEPLDIAPLANDSDPDGDPLTLDSLASGPFHGSATINASNNTLTYTADLGFDGSDTILYVVSDGHGGSATASIVISVTAPVSQSLAVIRGDANIDGQLDVSDPVETVLYLFDADPVACLLALDSNDDELVDLGDIIFSLNNLFSTGADPAAPYPFCGLDPTEGSLPCTGFGICD